VTDRRPHSSLRGRASESPPKFPTPEDVGRRVFLKVLGGSAAGALVFGCGADEQAHESAGLGGTGAAPSTDDAAVDASAGGSSGRSGSDSGPDVVADARPRCNEPDLDAGGCDAAPPGRGVGRPCDFSAFRIHSAYHEDVFQSALVGRDSDGWYARSAVCTHMGCNVAEPSAMVPFGIVCPCHGSEFDHHGNVLAGVAPTALRPVAIALGCDGELYVDTDTTVDPAFRLLL
jgi:Rieske Fe-S protein